MSLGFFIIFFVLGGGRKNIFYIIKVILTYISMNKFTDEHRKKLSESAKNRKCEIKEGMQVRKLHEFIEGIEHKECSKCKAKKQLNCFWKEQRRWDGLASKCNDCANAAALARYHNNIGYGAKNKKVVVNRRREIKKQCIEYLGNKCMKCGLEHDFPKNTSLFQFHHRDPKQKDFGVSTIGSRKFENQKDEIDKCDLLCANCHHLTHWELEKLDGSK